MRCSLRRAGRGSRFARASVQAPRCAARGAAAPMRVQGVGVEAGWRRGLRDEALASRLRPASFSRSRLAGLALVISSSPRTSRRDERAPQQRAWAFGQQVAPLRSSRPQAARRCADSAAAARRRRRDRAALALRLLFRIDVPAHISARHRLQIRDLLQRHVVDHAAQRVDGLLDEQALDQARHDLARAVIERIQPVPTESR